MYYNPSTESAIRSIEAVAEETRKVIQRLATTPVDQNKIVWSVTEGRWVNTPN